MGLLRKNPILKLKKTAFAFQQDAVNLIKDRDYFAIFHEQGLGKTKIAIDLIFNWLEHKKVDSVVIVCKKNLIQNWKNELDFHGNLPPVMLSNDKEDNLYKFNTPGFIYLCNYELIRSSLDSFEAFFRNRKIGIILDESTIIKNPSAKISKALHHLAKFCNKRIIMTGTPVANRPYDYWSQIYFLDFGERLGTNFDEFKENYDLGNDLGDSYSSQLIFKNALKELRQNLSDCFIRETKKTAGIELPGKRFIEVSVSMDEHQEKLYRDMQIELSAEILKDGEMIEENVEVILKRLLRLNQVSSNPGIIDDSYELIPPKLEETLKIVKKAQEENSKLIIWTNFIKNVDYISNNIGSNAVGIHGEKDLSIRNELIRKFQKDPSINVLVATPGVAKEGLTLTEANYAVFFDRDFSLDSFLQAQDRIHRMTQEKTCYIYKLLSANSIDYWIDALIEAKKIVARYSQGDIDDDEFDSNIRYDFIEILKEILIE
tara:strand:+ start:2001 stop:3461 length:1461 start_codon:yes stop_codon:yes gene_type:complete